MTGKNKEQFEKWYENKPLIDRTNPIRPRLAETFFKYPFEMQIGVYLAYYDSLEGIKFIADYDINKKKWFVWMVANDRVRMIRDEDNKAIWFDSRKEAQIELLKRADNIQNTV